MCTTPASPTCGCCGTRTATGSWTSGAHCTPGGGYTSRCSDTTCTASSVGRMGGCTGPSATGASTSSTRARSTRTTMRVRCCGRTSTARTSRCLRRGCGNPRSCASTTTATCGPATTTRTAATGRAGRTCPRARRSAGATPSSTSASRTRAAPGMLRRSGTLRTRASPPTRCPALRTSRTAPPGSRTTRVRGSAPTGVGTSSCATSAVGRGTVACMLSESRPRVRASSSPTPSASSGTACRPTWTSGPTATSTTPTGSMVGE